MTTTDDPTTRRSDNFVPVTPAGKPPTKATTQPDDDTTGDTPADTTTGDQPKATDVEGLGLAVPAAVCTLALLVIGTLVAVEYLGAWIGSGIAVGMVAVAVAAWWVWAWFRDRRKGRRKRTGTGTGRRGSGTDSWGTGTARPGTGGTGTTGKRGRGGNRNKTGTGTGKQAARSGGTGTGKRGGNRLASYVPGTEAWRNRRGGKAHGTGKPGGTGGRGGGRAGTGNRAGGGTHNRGTGSRRNHSNTGASSGGMKAAAKKTGTGAKTAATATGRAMRDAVKAVAPETNTAQKATKPKAAKPQENANAKPKTKPDAKPSPQTQVNTHTVDTGDTQMESEILTGSRVMFDGANRDTMHSLEAGFHTILAQLGPALSNVAGAVDSLNRRGIEENSTVLDAPDIVESLSLLKNVLDAASEQARETFVMLQKSDRYQEFMKRMHDPNGDTRDVRLNKTAGM